LLLSVLLESLMLGPLLLLSVLRGWLPVLTLVGASSALTASASPGLGGGL